MKKLTDVLKDIGIGVFFLSALGVVGWGMETLKQIVYPAENKQEIKYDYESTDIPYNIETGRIFK